MVFLAKRIKKGKVYFCFQHTERVGKNKWKSRYWGHFPARWNERGFKAYWVATKADAIPLAFELRRSGATLVRIRPVDKGIGVFYRPTKKEGRKCKRYRGL